MKLLLVSDLQLTEHLDKWPTVSKFSTPTQSELNLFKQQDTIVFYTHPRRLRHHKKWVKKIKIMLLEIRMSFEGTLLLLVPFSKILSTYIDDFKDIMGIHIKTIKARGFYSNILSETQSSLLSTFLSKTMLESVRVKLERFSL